MRTEARRVPQPEFKPFTLEITVESKEDLRCLYHRMNIGMKDVIENSDDGDIGFPDTKYDEQVTMPIFDSLTTFAKMNGMIEDDL